MPSLFPYAPDHRQVKERRSFISNLLKASMASAVVFSLGDAHAWPVFSIRKNYTVGDVMDIILKAVPGAPFEKTVDTLKSGNREMVVTGIVTTMFATVNIIQQAVKAGANFIIAHEPTFYNHLDDPAWVSPNHIVQQKQALLEQHKITVWRLHDYWHSVVPDGINYGVVKKAGWLAYYNPASKMLELPAISLGKLAQHLKATLKIGHVRVIGNLSQTCRRVAVSPGASGGESHVSTVEKKHPDTLVVGELREWETAEYIRDSLQMGGHTSLIVLGHSVSEEPGMEWLQQWLQPKLEGLKITHLVSGDPFTWV